MARTSHAEYVRALDLPNSPVEAHARYMLSEIPPDEEIAKRHREDEIGFAHLENRLGDLFSGPVDFGPGEHPFPARYCREVSTFRFNITAYSQALLSEFQRDGGKIQIVEFHNPGDLTALPQPVIVHCTGFGARSLFDDASLTPVRGQIGWLPAQPEANYSVISGRMNMEGRRDGIVGQVGAASDATGWDDASELPDPEESAGALLWLKSLQQHFRRAEQVSGTEPRA